MLVLGVFMIFMAILSSTPLAHISWVWTGKEEDTEEEKQFPGSKFKKSSGQI